VIIEKLSRKPVPNMDLVFRYLGLMDEIIGGMMRWMM